MKAFKSINNRSVYAEREIRRIRGQLNTISAGSAIIFPSGGAGAHGFLSNQHSDTTPAGPTRGDLIVANSTSKWGRFALGAAGTILSSDGSDPVWNNYLNVIQSTIGNPVSVLSSVATNDDVVEFTVQARGATSDDTPTTIYSFPIAPDTIVHFRATVIARRTGGSGGTSNDGAAYEIAGTFKSDSGSAVQLGSMSILHAVADQPAWAAAFSVSTVFANLQVTGAADNNITWHATIRIYVVGS